MKTLILIAIAGFSAQLVDGGLGMGFGVTSTTILITLASLTPATASAVVHTAEVGTTFVSGLSHWRFGNVDWKVVAKIGVPGAIGAFLGATVLSNISTDAARPVTATILTAIGVYLLIRFSRGQVQRKVNPRPHSGGFLAGLGVTGGFIDATGGGGWGPVTTSTLLAMGRSEPRRIVGTVNTAEFLVALAATLGFVVGLWEDLISNLAAVVALLIGGMIAAPIAAWMISRINAAALGAIVGSLLMVLNGPTILGYFGVEGPIVWGLQIAAVVLGIVAAVAGVRRTRKNFMEAASELPKTDIEQEPTRVEA